MAIRTYSLKKDGDKFVSKNFRVREFACNDGSDIVKIDDALITMIQKVRDYFGKPIIINSAYRTPSYNKKVGGSPKSQHMQGMAADIVVKGVSPDEVYKYCDKTFTQWGGVGRYSNFTHIDCRWKVTRWDYR